MVHKTTWRFFFRKHRNKNKCYRNRWNKKRKKANVLVFSFKYHCQLYTYETSNYTADEIFNSADFIQEILLCIPAKQLFKFKCVCKQWLSIISDLQFGYDHTSKSPNPSSLGLYFYKTIPLFSIMGLKNVPNDGVSSLPPLGFLGTAKLIDSCNGLALALHLNGTSKTYIICNPTTKKLRVLPKAVDVNFTVWRVYELFTFDPAKSSHFKVIIMYYTKIGAHRIVIFSSKEGSWKEMSFRVTLGVPATPIIFFNGSLHWLTTNNDHYKFVVDPEELKSNAIGQNPKIRTNNVRYLGVCNGHLYLAMGGLLTNMCTVFEMEWDTGVWVSKHRINFKDIIYQRVDEGSKFYVLDILKRSSDSSLTLVLATPGGFVSYDTGRGIIQVLSDFLPPEFGEIPNEWTNLGSCSYRFSDSLFPI